MKRLMAKNKSHEDQSCTLLIKPHILSILIIILPEYPIDALEKNIKKWYIEAGIIIHSDNNGQRIDFDLKDVSIHPKFNERKVPKYDNDVAIIKVCLKKVEEHFSLHSKTDNSYKKSIEVRGKSTFKIVVFQA